MDDIVYFFHQEIAGSYDIDYQRQIEEYLDTINEFIDNAYEEVREDLLTSGDVVENSRYNEIVNELMKYKNKYGDLD
jgi:hypothetical protein